MYLKDKQSGDLVEILDLAVLADPCADSINGRLHAGEELQEPVVFAKVSLLFPSGEELPRCWVDAHYRDSTVRR